MKVSRRVALAVSALLFVSLAVVPALARQQTATQFYLGYRTAFAKATKIDDLLPFMAKQRVDQVNGTPAADRVQIFQMIKMMDTVTDVKVVKETKTATGATLSVEGLDENKKKSTGTVEVVKEGGAWKLDQESWNGSM
jgi:hypothetical protein